MPTVLDECGMKSHRPAVGFEDLCSGQRLLDFGTGTCGHSGEGWLRWEEPRGGQRCPRVHSWLTVTLLRAVIRGYFLGGPPSIHPVPHLP